MRPDRDAGRIRTRALERARIHATRKCGAGCRCVDAFEALGLERAALASLSGGDRYRLIVERLLALQGHHTKQYALAMLIFGRDAVDVLPLEREQARLTRGPLEG